MDQPAVNIELSDYDDNVWALLDCSPGPPATADDESTGTDR